VKRKYLQNLRKKRELTQQEIAEELGITAVFYGMIERGERNPTLELARKIAIFFNSTIDEIFFDEKLYKMYTSLNTA